MKTYRVGFLVEGEALNTMKLKAKNSNDAMCRVRTIKGREHAGKKILITDVALVEGMKKLGSACV